MKKMIQKKILCIDQSPESIELMRRILEHGGIQSRFRAAIEGPEGLKIALEEIPDLILLDMHLPAGEAWSLLEQIRSNKKLKATYIIGFSKVAYEENVLGKPVTEPQPDAYLQKPFVVRQLLDTAIRFLKINQS